MQSFFEARSASRVATLDTDQPSVRHIQGLIRQGTPVTLHLSGGTSVEGVLRWQDVHCLAVDPGDGAPLTLVSRDAVMLLRQRA